MDFNFVGFSAVTFVALAASMLCQSAPALPTFGDVFAWLGGSLVLIGCVELLARYSGEAGAVQDKR